MQKLSDKGMTTKQYPLTKSLLVRDTDMKTIGLGPGAILDMQITVREKEKKEPIKEMGVRYPFLFYKEQYSGLLTITKEDMDIAIDIWNPQSASKENDNISDADFALKILEKWDNEPALSLRENMKLIPKNSKRE